MAVAMLLEWPGETEQQYECLMDLVALEKDPPEGGFFMLAGPCPGAGGCWIFGNQKRH